MLLNLTIDNIAVARHLDISFREGFTAITGKTGAGKSILIDSLLLLCGAKNGRELIRTGEDYASVSAIFDSNPAVNAVLDEFGCPSDDDEIQITRRITADGRSTVKINRRTVTMSALRDISPLLLGIQTQDERSAFADKSTYVSLLDSFADDETELAAYREKYEILTGIRSEISSLRDSLSNREMMLDILRYQKKEIDAAKLNDNDEEEKLNRLRARLKNSEKTAKYSALVTRALAFSEKGATAAYLLERAESALGMLGDVVEGADEMAAKLNEFRYEIIDIAERVKDQADTENIGNPAEKLNQVENRLALIEKLEKKYGVTIADIKAKSAEINAKLAALEEGDSRLDELEKAEKKAVSEASEAALRLSEIRREAAGKLTDEIVSSLRFLDMPKVRFRITVTPLREGTAYRFMPDGADDVDFLISVNTGEELQSLGRVSSGGELSRITLAVKTALAGHNDSGTLIFDEIDTGVSGGTSERIGLMLEKLAVNSQVISVTHSPQIASLASCHLLIEKKESDGRTESSVREITGDERTEEIARIIGGISITEKQTEAAREMLSRRTETEY